MDNFNPQHKGERYFINKENYLEFHQDLFGSGIDIEKKANNLISEQIGGNFLVFFVGVLHKKTHMGCVRLLGTEELKHEIRFPIQRGIMEDSMLTGKIQLLPSNRLTEELLSRVAEVNMGVPEQFLCVPFLPPTTTYAPLMCCVMDVCDKCACSIISAPPPKSSQLAERQQIIVSIVLDVFRYCGCALAYSMMYDSKRVESEQSDALLEVADKLFRSLDDVSGVLRLVMTEARRLTHAERCSLFLVDKLNNMLVAKVFDDEKIADVELPIDRGIVGKVAKTGGLMNVKDVYNHPLFFREIDEITGFVTRAVLCVPILTDNEVIAVAELCNKEEGYGEFFTILDEHAAQSFASYCGICIKHTILYQKTTVAKARQNITNELMMYHLRMQVLEEEVMQVLLCRKNHRKAYHYHEYRYSARDIDDEHTPCVLLEMFKDLRLLSTYQIPESTFVRCVLYFKKGYRALPYHNWSHAMAVVHFGYALVRNLKLVERGYIEQLDALAFLISCMGHDIDHRGTTNAYQNHAQTALASLYSSEGSVMEHHHFNQTVLILSLDDCNVLEKLNKDDYLRVLDWIRYLILATDLAHHLHRQDSIRKKVQRYHKNKESHKRALLSLLISCSDLSCAAKEWSTARRLAESVYEEFFTEGDLALRLGYAAGSLMSRTSAKIPEQQISFLERVCIPIFSTLQILFPQIDELVNMLSDNARIWEIAKPYFYTRQDKGQDSLDILTCPEFEEEVIAAANEQGLRQDRRRRKRAESKMVDMKDIRLQEGKVITDTQVIYKDTSYEDNDSTASLQGWMPKGSKVSESIDVGAIIHQENETTQTSLLDASMSEDPSQPQAPSTMEPRSKSQGSSMSQGSSKSQRPSRVQHSSKSQRPSRVEPSSQSKASSRIPDSKDLVTEMYGAQTRNIRTQPKASIAWGHSSRRTSMVEWRKSTRSQDSKSDSSEDSISSFVRFKPRKSSKTPT